LAVLVVLVLLAGFPLSVLADDDDQPTFTPNNDNLIVLRDIGAQSPRGAPGDTVRIILPLAVNQEETPTENFRLTNITIEPVIAYDWPFDIIQASYLQPLRDMSFNDTATIFYDFRISQRASRGVHPVDFTISATVWRDAGTLGSSISENVTFTVGVHLTVTIDGHEAFPPAPPAVGGPLHIAGTVDGRGVLPTPVGRPGELVTMHIPIVNMGGRLTDITVGPVVDGSLEHFPFEAQHINYGRNLADMPHGGEVTLDFTFRVSSYATSGTKLIEFRAIHRENGVLGVSTFFAHIRIEGGFMGEDVTAVTSDGFELISVDNRQRLDGDRLMAGESVILRIPIHNNSSRDSARNVYVGITLADTSALSLSFGHSDTAFIAHIEPEETEWAEFHITARGTATPGPSVVNVSINYTPVEQWSAWWAVGISPWSPSVVQQNIMIPISQPIRLGGARAEPFGQQREGSPIAVNLIAINMGRGRLYNLWVEADEGIRMDIDSSFFFNDLPPGGTLDADIQIVSDQSGEFTGRLLLHFEDANGDEHTEEIELLLNVGVPLPPQPEPGPPLAPPRNPNSGGVAAATTGLSLLAAGSGGWYYLKIFKRR